MAVHYIPRFEGSDLDRMVNMLVKGGYSADMELESGPETLGHQEYQCYGIGGRIMLVLGAGRSGDDGAYTNFYFMPDSEDFVEHGTSSED